MHPCSLAQLGSAATDGAGNGKGPRCRALVRARQQHLARASADRGVASESGASAALCTRKPTTLKPSRSGRRKRYMRSRIVLLTLACTKSSNASQALRAADKFLEFAVLTEIERGSHVSQQRSPGDRRSRLGPA